MASQRVIVSLLREIQASILDPNCEIGPILLKLRFLASRLGSTQLEEWVKYESEGYPTDVEVPEYRKIGVSYLGTFFGSFHSEIQNAPIPPYLIEKFAGKGWTKRAIRESIAAIDELASHEGGVIHIDASDLILMLQGKVYPDYACNSVIGNVSKTAIREIQNAVRNRILELTIELEKAVPAAVEVTLAKPVGAEAAAAKAVTQIFNQTVYGTSTTVTSIGAGAQITLNIAKGDSDAMIGELVKAGIPHDQAEEFAKILADEKPESREVPFGEWAKEWLARNLRKAAEGAWKIGVEIAKRAFEEAALQYYGLK